MSYGWFGSTLLTAVAFAVAALAGVCGVMLLVVARRGAALPGVAPLTHARTVPVWRTGNLTSPSTDPAVPVPFAAQAPGGGGPDAVPRPAEAAVLRATLVDAEARTVDAAQPADVEQADVEPEAPPEAAPEGDDDVEPEPREHVGSAVPGSVHARPVAAGTGPDPHPAGDAVVGTPVG